MAQDEGVIFEFYQGVACVSLSAVRMAEERGREVSGQCCIRTIDDWFILANLEDGLEVLRSKVGDAERGRQFTLVLHILQDLPAIKV